MIEQVVTSMFYFAVLLHRVYLSLSYTWSHYNIVSNFKTKQNKQGKTFAEDDYEIGESRMNGALFK